MCFDFSRGRCDRGAACRYEHVAMDRADAARICYDFANGKCSRENCRFLHDASVDPNKIPAPTKETKACFDFLEGRCNRDVCKFVHDKDAAAKHRASDRGSRSGDKDRGRDERRRSRSRERDRERDRDDHRRSRHDDDDREKDRKRKHDDDDRDAKRAPAGPTQCQLILLSQHPAVKYVVCLELLLVAVVADL